MQWIDNFSSSNVSQFAYSDEGLYVQFHDGSIYLYDVGPDTFEDMIRAGSKGRFVWRRLRGHEIGKWKA